MIIWLIGLSGSGKTTVGEHVYRAMKARNPATVWLDGDAFRALSGDTLGHSQADREHNGWRICRTCQWLDREGIDVVACVLSNFPEQQQWNREHLDDYFEVFLDVPLKTLEARDSKGLYRRFREGTERDVVGLDIEFATPPNPDLVIENAGDVTPEAAAEQVLQALRDREGKRL